MSGYLSSRKLTNVKGRLQYITNKSKQENIIDYFNTTDNNFWNLLAKECRARHKEANAGGKCCEARELIIGIPQDSNITAKQICNIFKTKYHVECSCSIHQNNKNGIINKHCHLVFSERKLLTEPQIENEKRAIRTYYYNEKGVKCKKADAVKIVKKGDIIQKGTTRYFSDKDDYFKSQKFIYNCKDLFLNNTFRLNWSLQSELANKELSQKHIGKYNPKAEYIKQSNSLKSTAKTICSIGDLIKNKENGTTLKEFKERYAINSFSAVLFEENSNKVAQLRNEIVLDFHKEVQKEVKHHNNILSDVNTLKVPSTSSIFTELQEKIVDQYKNDYQIENIDNKFHLIDFLKVTMNNIYTRLKNLISKQDLLNIEKKNQIDIEKDRNDRLHIKDNSYSRTHTQAYEYEEPTHDDWDLEI